jgi:hypothetical protein
MARGDRSGFGWYSGGGNSADQNRDGVADDIDRRPGNQSESAEYSQRYDRRSETEFTNLPETARQLRFILQDEELQEQARITKNALRAAQSNVHFFPSVGKFIIPEGEAKDTWLGHADLVKDRSTNLYFRPEKYVYFDKIVAEQFGNRALYDEKHPDYAKYEGLRTNIAVLRNDIVGNYLKDGGFDPGDEKYIPLIAGVATAIGKALSHDKWYLRPFTRSLSVDVANVEGVGAREIYKFLLEEQTSPGPIPMFHRAFMNAIGAAQTAWELVPLEKTPFSDAALSAPPPSRKLKLTAAELVQAAASPQLRARVTALLTATGERMAMTGEIMLKQLHELRTVDAMEAPSREASVEEARTILRRLRNMELTDESIEAWLDHGTPDQQVGKTEDLARLVDIYTALAQQRKKQTYPARYEDAWVDDGADAAAAAAIAVAEHGMSLSIPTDGKLLGSIDSLIEGLPPQGEQRLTQSFEQLLDTMETGIERASGKKVGDVSPADTLLNVSNRLASSAYKVRAIELLEPPARSESVELAREILRKLKNLSFSRQSVGEMVNSGRPEDKAALAKKIHEAVDIYENLLEEAAQINPNILSDPRIKEANDAVGSFSHAIKLMAAKEIPNSVATAQQISADVTRMPEEWKKLHDRTVDRLITSMEGGLEKAVGDIESQQHEQQQQQDEELAQQVADQSIHNISSRKRRRKRSGSRQPAALTKSAKRRNAGDLNGDGVLDKFQGLDLGGQQINLSDKDLAAIRSLGGNLRSIGDQAAELAPPSTAASDKIVPDDKGFAEQKTLRDEQQRNGNRNNRPRT